MQNVIPDERYSVADEAILGAFFKLLKEKKPDRITVSDITKTAGIARSTFYNHYQDIPSLISAANPSVPDYFFLLRSSNAFTRLAFAVMLPGFAFAASL